jgi:hypothetical protein
MSEEVNESTTAEASAPQDNTNSDGVKEVDTESTLLKVEDSTPSEATQTEVKPDEQASKSDLLGDIKQPDGNESAPEKYEPFTLADGKEMDASDVEMISEVAKTHNLTQEDAQKAALVANDLFQKMVDENEASQAKVAEENAATWKAQDTTGELTLLAQKAVTKLGPEMEKHLRDNNYLNDARIMSLLADYGKEISEGKSISGKPATTQSLLYPNTPSLYEQ